MFLCMDKRTSKFAVDFRAAVAPLMGKADECWEWPGRKSNGYGSYQHQRRHYAVHRRSYEEFVGAIPDGMHICHRCDNPPCWNPAHLFLGTPRDNLHDMIRKGRGRNPIFLANKAKTHCSRGHPFTDDNTYRKGNARACRMCSFMYTRLARERAKAEREPRQRVTHCPSGHEYTPDNCYWANRPNRPNPVRICRRCMIDAQKRLRERKKAQA